MSLFVGFVIGAFIAYTVTLIFMGTLMQAQAEKIKMLKATLFGVEQELLAEREGRTRPLYEMATDGVDPVIRRRRPLDEQEPLRSSPESADGTIDLTGVEDE
jgi:hypothetical protein